MQKKKPNIGIDLLGSDTLPENLLQAAINFSKEFKDSLEITVFGTPDLYQIFKKNPPSLHFHVVQENITMEEDPLTAIRRKKDSSINEGIRFLKEKKIDAFISAGNTGALAASAILNMPLFPSIAHPALLALIPTKKQPLAIIDIGASITCQIQDYLQFSLQAIAFQKAQGIEKPKVGLLNIGIEEKKGTSNIRAAYKDLQKFEQDPSYSFSFKGNIEGKKVFEGDVDILVTNGFTGNVLLKTAEGLASFILDQIKTDASEKELIHITPLLKKLNNYLHYEQYPGAFLCGIDGIVIKCHGDSSPHAILNGIKGALHFIKINIIENIKKYLEGKI